MDIRLPRMSGIACTARLKPLIPHTQILILTVSADSDTIFRALEAGADGYLLKRSSPEELQAAVLEVMKGGRADEQRDCPAGDRLVPPAAGQERRRCRLTPREEEILILLVQGLCEQGNRRQTGREL